jgi:hypothetical protein
LRAERSNPGFVPFSVDCFAAALLAMTKPVEQASFSP